MAKQNFTLKRRKSITVKELWAQVMDYPEHVDFHVEDDDRRIILTHIEENHDAILIHTSYGQYTMTGSDLSSELLRYMTPEKQNMKVFVCISHPHYWNIVGIQPKGEYTFLELK